MTKKRRQLSQDEIDALAEAQAHDDAAWDDPILVRRASSSSVSLPSELTARAIFVARLHHEMDVETWLRRIIKERIELEEAAFSALKRELTAKNGD